MFKLFEQPLSETREHVKISVSLQRELIFQDSKVWRIVCGGRKRLKHVSETKCISERIVQRLLIIFDLHCVIMLAVISEALGSPN